MRQGSVQFRLVVDAPREGRVSRNYVLMKDGKPVKDAPREGRVSRNPRNKVKMSDPIMTRPARGV